MSSANSDGEERRLLPIMMQRMPVEDASWTMASTKSCEGWIMINDDHVRLHLPTNTKLRTMTNLSILKTI
jgi:hypothetical protein